MFANLTIVLAASVPALHDAGVGIRPSFMLDDRAWLATHVFVATEGDAIDGKLEILESWLGDLEPGDEVVIGDLARFAPAPARAIFHWFQKPPDGQPKEVSGQRMIVFLTRDGGDWKAATDGLGGFGVSVMWVEGAKTYAKIQVINPGEAVPVESGGGERNVRSRFGVVRAIKREHQATLAIADGGTRAKRLVGSVRSDVWRAQNEAIEALGRIGTPAMSTLRALIAAADLVKLRGRLIGQLAAAGGPAAGPDLDRILEVELRWWEANGPKLESGWWNQLGPERAERTRRYGIVYAAVEAMGSSRWAEGRRIVAEMRDLWLAHGALNEIGNGQIAKVCAATLDALD